MLEDNNNLHEAAETNENDDVNAVGEAAHGIDTSVDGEPKENNTIFTTEDTVETQEGNTTLDDTVSGDILEQAGITAVVTEPITEEFENQQDVMLSTPQEYQDGSDQNQSTVEESTLIKEQADENQNAIAAVEDSNASEAELEKESDLSSHPTFDNFSMEDLVAYLDTLLAADKAISARHQIEEIKKSFLNKFYKFADEKRAAYYEENPDATEDFSLNFPLKQKFDNLFSNYRDQKTKHQKNTQATLEANLKKRVAIVEEIKNLINPQENIKDVFKHFNELREQWRGIGPIPKDKYNHVWNNYHFHVENFYDYLHLDREARDFDFKYNLEHKLKIIDRAQGLLEYSDVNKAFRELQALHKIWKEELGPVSREHRENIWQKFSNITKQLHDKREQLLQHSLELEQDNLAKKRELLTEIEALTAEKITSHKSWIEQIEKLETLRKLFLASGRVPKEEQEQMWSAFRNAIRAFNAAKNNFYKEHKKEQNDNLSRKKALVAKALELSKSDDFAEATPIMKQIQEEWKTIGYIPRKISDALWKEFKTACNDYFKRLKENRNSGSPEEMEAYEKKKTALETLRIFEFSGDHKTDLEAIKQHIESWKNIGRVPEGKRSIEVKFNKLLDGLFEQLNLSRKETEMVRFSNKIEQLAGSDQGRKLENEKIFLQRKIEEVQSEIFQLENNIQFFTTAKKENPMVAEVRKSIEKQRDQLQILKDKLKQIHKIKAE